MFAVLRLVLSSVFVLTLGHRRGWFRFFVVSVYCGLVVCGFRLVRVVVECFCLGWLSVRYCVVWLMGFGFCGFVYYYFVVVF